MDSRNNQVLFTIRPRRRRPPQPQQQQQLQPHAEAASATATARSNRRKSSTVAVDASLIRPQTYHHHLTAPPPPPSQPYRITRRHNHNNNNDHTHSDNNGAPPTQQTAADDTMDATSITTAINTTPPSHAPALAPAKTTATTYTTAATPVAAAAAANGRTPPPPPQAHSPQTQPPLHAAAQHGPPQDCSSSADNNTKQRVIAVISPTSRTTITSNNSPTQLQQQQQQQQGSPNQSNHHRNDHQDDEEEVEDSDSFWEPDSHFTLEQREQIGSYHANNKNYNNNNMTRRRGGQGKTTNTRRRRRRRKSYNNNDHELGNDASNNTYAGPPNRRRTFSATSSLLSEQLPRATTATSAAAAIGNEPAATSHSAGHLHTPHPPPPEPAPLCAATPETLAAAAAASGSRLAWNESKTSTHRRTNNTFAITVPNQQRAQAATAPADVYTVVRRSKTKEGGAIIRRQQRTRLPILQPDMGLPYKQHLDNSSRFRTFEQTEPNVVLKAQPLVLTSNSTWSSPQHVSSSSYHGAALHPHHGAAALPLPSVFFVMGPPGAGKCTIAERICATTPGFIRISIGALLSAAVEAKARKQRRIDAAQAQTQQQHHHHHRGGDAGSSGMFHVRPKVEQHRALVVQAHPRSVSAAAAAAGNHTYGGGSGGNIGSREKGRASNQPNSSRSSGDNAKTNEVASSPHLTDMLSGEDERSVLLRERLHDCSRNHTPVSSELAADLLKSAIECLFNAGVGHRFFIDGFPRDRFQWRAWHHIVGNRAAVLGKFVFNCPADLCKQRLLKRREKLSRSEDSLTSIKMRFRSYVQFTQPLIQAFCDDTASNADVVLVDASSSLASVEARVRHELAAHASMADLSEVLLAPITKKVVPPRKVVPARVSTGLLAIKASAQASTGAHLAQLVEATQRDAIISKEALKNPGPGYYDVYRDDMGTKGISFAKESKRKKRLKEVTPGPGEYLNKTPAESPPSARRSGNRYKPSTHVVSAKHAMQRRENEKSLHLRRKHLRPGQDSGDLKELGVAGLLKHVSTLEQDKRKMEERLQAVEERLKDYLTESVKRGSMSIQQAAILRPEDSTFMTSVPEDGGVGPPGNDSRSKEQPEKLSTRVKPRARQQEQQWQSHPSKASPSDSRRKKGRKEVGETGGIRGAAKGIGRRRRQARGASPSSKSPSAAVRHGKLETRGRRNETKSSGSSPGGKLVSPLRERNQRKEVALKAPQRQRVEDSGPQTTKSENLGASTNAEPLRNDVQLRNGSGKEEESKKHDPAEFAAMGTTDLDLVWDDVGMDNSDLTLGNSFADGEAAVSQWKSDEDVAPPLGRMESAKRSTKSSASAQEAGKTPVAPPESFEPVPLPERLCLALIVGGPGSGVETNSKRFVEDTGPVPENLLPGTKNISGNFNFLHLDVRALLEKHDALFETVKQRKEREREERRVAGGATGAASSVNDGTPAKKRILSPAALVNLTLLELTNMAKNRGWSANASNDAGFRFLLTHFPLSKIAWNELTTALLVPESVSIVCLKLDCSDNIRRERLLARGLSAQDKPRGIAARFKAYGDSIEDLLGAISGSNIVSRTVSTMNTEDKVYSSARRAMVGLLAPPASTTITTKTRRQRKGKFKNKKQPRAKSSAEAVVAKQKQMGDKSDDPMDWPVNDGFKKPLRKPKPIKETQITDGSRSDVAHVSTVSDGKKESSIMRREEAPTDQSPCAEPGIAAKAHDSDSTSAYVIRMGQKAKKKKARIVVVLDDNPSVPVPSSKSKSSVTPDMQTKASKIATSTSAPAPVDASAPVSDGDGSDEKTLNLDLDDDLDIQEGDKQRDSASVIISRLPEENGEGDGRSILAVKEGNRVPDAIAQQVRNILSASPSMKSIDITKGVDDACVHKLLTATRKLISDSYLGSVAKLTFDMNQFDAVLRVFASVDNLVAAVEVAAATRVHCINASLEAFFKSPSGIFLRLGVHDADDTTAETAKKEKGPLFEVEGADFDHIVKLAARAKAPLPAIGKEVARLSNSDSVGGAKHFRAVQDAIHHLERMARVHRSFDSAESLMEGLAGVIDSGAYSAEEVGVKLVEYLHSPGTHLCKSNFSFTLKDLDEMLEVFSRWSLAHSHLEKLNAAFGRYDDFASLLSALKAGAKTGRYVDDESIATLRKYFTGKKRRWHVLSRKITLSDDDYCNMIMSAKGVGPCIHTIDQFELIVRHFSSSKKLCDSLRKAGKTGMVTSESSRKKLLSFINDCALFVGERAFSISQSDLDSMLRAGRGWGKKGLTLPKLQYLQREGKTFGTFDQLVAALEGVDGATVSPVDNGDDDDR